MESNKILSSQEECQIENIIDQEQEEIKKNQQQQKYIRRKIAKMTGLIACWLSIITGTTFGFGEIIKKLPLNKKYHTTIEIYDKNGLLLKTLEGYQNDYLENIVIIEQYDPVNKNIQTAKIYQDIKNRDLNFHLDLNHITNLNINSLNNKQAIIKKITIDKNKFNLEVTGVIECVIIPTGLLIFYYSLGEISAVIALKHRKCDYQILNASETYLTLFINEYLSLINKIEYNQLVPSLTKVKTKTKIKK